MAAAAGAMGAVVWAASRAVGSPSGGGAIVRMVVGVVVGIVVYGGGVLLLRVEEVHGLRERLLRR
jgi:putative peptidoglycan lipid II flippase